MAPPTRWPRPQGGPPPTRRPRPPGSPPGSPDPKPLPLSPFNPDVGGRVKLGPEDLQQAAKADPPAPEKAAWAQGEAAEQQGRMCDKQGAGEVP